MESKEVIRRETIHMQNVSKLIVGEEVLESIRYLNAKISREEWSGVAFYEVLEGTIEDVDSLVLELKYVWPMKKGSTASVEFDFDVDWIKVYNKIPALEDYKRGIIHSHNSMAAYHSGTDYNDLSTNCGLFDFYLSIVVNNKGDFDTKIAIPAEEEMEAKYNYSFRNSLGKIIKGLSPKEESTTRAIMFVHNVEVETPTPPVNDSIFEERVEEIIKEATKSTYYPGAYGRQSHEDAWAERYSGYGLGKPKGEQTRLFEEVSPTTPTVLGSDDETFSLLYLDGGEELLTHALVSIGHVEGKDAVDVELIEALASFLDILDDKAIKDKETISFPEHVLQIIDNFIAFFIEGIKELEEYKEIKDPVKSLDSIQEWLEILEENLEMYPHEVVPFIIKQMKVVINSIKK